MLKTLNGQFKAALSYTTSQKFDNCASCSFMTLVTDSPQVRQMNLLLGRKANICSDIVLVFLGSAGGDSVEQHKEKHREEVFTVELRRGPHGLGLALVDGTVRRKNTTQLQTDQPISPLFTADC